MITLGPGGGQHGLVEDAKRRRALHALLDLLAFEGIYPSLSPGVGVPLEKRMISILPAGVVAKQASAEPRDKVQSDRLLKRILDILESVLSDTRPSIQPIIRNRILPDILCAAGELGYNSQCLSQSDTGTYQNAFEELINEYASLTYVL